MKRAPRLLAAIALAFCVGPAARAQTTLAALEEASAADATSESAPRTDDDALRAALVSEARNLGKSLREDVATAIARAEREQGIPAFLIVALIAQESGFDPAAENDGALGLMQIRPFVGRAQAARSGMPWKGEKTLLDPVRNVQLATGYLAELVDRYGAIDLALAAYNKGPERVKQWLRDGEDGPMPRYVADVMKRYERYNARFAGF